MSELAAELAGGSEAEQTQDTEATIETTNTENTEIPWYGDKEYDALVETKGWKAPRDVLQSYENLSKLVGADKVALPKGDDDVAAYEAIWNRLGRPESPDKYKLDAEGIDENAVKGFAETAYKAGLTAAQAKAVIGFYKGTETQAIQAVNEQFVAQSNKEMDALKSEHGAAYEQFYRDAKRGVREFGLSETQLESLERAVGTKTMMSMLARQGSYLREDTSDGESANSLRALSPAAARSEMGNLRMDDAFQKAYMDSNHPGHKDAIAKMERLAKYATGGV